MRVNINGLKVLRQILQWKERESGITNGVGGTSNIWNTEERVIFLYWLHYIFCLLREKVVETLVIMSLLFKRISRVWCIATLLKVRLFHGCFSWFLNCTNGTKSRKASCVLAAFILTMKPFVRNQILKSHKDFRTFSS